uniref:FAD-binding FR-type domain-containing protein n=2 Tax=Corethron hystrix TaxID=216773 RepID=A0A6U5HDT5_9STRA|mmetsp:Transcript_29223/g.67065  ORF Transcript_29223/g.67065 Transcript_29223/m.67065 type:complete len:571 (+) Transcript_29223:186-1898(+)
MRRRISYEAAFWMVFLSTTALFVMDRLTTNFWPRQSFSNTFSTGSDNFEFKDGPWTVRTYDIFARVSGRFTMIALNALFFTMMKTSYQYISENLDRYIDFSDDTAPLRIHKWIGISLCVVTIIHVWSILFPVFISNYGFKIVPGSFTFPLSEKKPNGFKDVDAAKKMVMMQIDDLYRLIMISILLGPLIFYSVKKISTNYRLGIRIHQFVMLMYFVDIVRRHTHPHSWVLNVPVFFLWVLDYCYGVYFRGATMVKIETVEIGSNYIAIFWKNPCAVFQKKSGIGDIIHILPSYGKNFIDDTAERKHPFTSLTRRSNNGQYTWTLPWFDQATEFRIHNSGKKLEKVLPTFERQTTSAFEWDRCVIMRTYTNKRSLTKKLRMEKHVNIWGTFPTGAITQVVNSKNNIFMVAGGSGSGYIIDTLHYIVHHRQRLDDSTVPGEPRSRFLVILTTYDYNLVKWWSVVLQDLILHNQFPDSIDVSICIAFTGIMQEPGKIKPPLDFQWGTLHVGRMNLGAVMKDFTIYSNNKFGNHCFCQGSSKLQYATRKAAKENNVQYHECHFFDDTRASNFPV